jgi:hypothetical protein
MFVCEAGLGSWYRDVVPAGDSTRRLLSPGRVLSTGLHDARTYLLKRRIHQGQLDQGYACLSDFTTITLEEMADTHEPGCDPVPDRMMAAMTDIATQAEVFLVDPPDG